MGMYSCPCLCVNSSQRTGMSRCPSHEISSWKPTPQSGNLLRMNPKQRAAEAALKYVASGMVVGLGTGSTADQFLQALARDIKSGKLTNIKGVPTSVQSERRAKE